MKQEHEILNAHAAVANQEILYRDLMSPEQKAWMMACRCALAWVLDLKKGGRKIEQMLQGLPVFAVTDPHLGRKFLEEQGGRPE